MSGRPELDDVARYGRFIGNGCEAYHTAITEAARMIADVISSCSTPIEPHITHLKKQVRIEQKRRVR